MRRIPYRKLKVFARGLRLHRKYADATMIPRRNFVDNLLIASDALTNPALERGAVVECGTWKGGMAAAMMELGGRQRPYYFFDSFEGLPPADTIDGESAIAWQNDTASPYYYDNCSASLEEFRAVIARAGPHDRISVHKGFFNTTFPDVVVPTIAVLRLDADWYSSTMECLEKFWDSVLPDGIILIDDYGAWEGCTKAVHDFLSRRQRAEPVDKGRLGRAFFIRKRRDESGAPAALSAA